MDLYVPREPRREIKALQWEPNDPFRIMKYLVENEIHFNFYASYINGDIELTVDPYQSCGNKVHLNPGDFLTLDGDKYERMNFEEFCKTFRIMTMEDVTAGDEQ